MKNKQTKSAKIEFLTDDAILALTENDPKKVVTNEGDCSLKGDNSLKTTPGGLYDYNIFGSIFPDSCNCGQIHEPGITCPNCSSRILTQEEMFTTFGRIELPIYYLNDLHYVKFLEFMLGHFSFSMDESVTHKLKDKIVWDCFQFEPEVVEDKLTIRITSVITDLNKCSYEGLMMIISQYKPELLQTYRSFINKYILVTPIAIRPAMYEVVNNKKLLVNHEYTVIYKNIIYCANYFRDNVNKLSDEENKSAFAGSLRVIANELAASSSVIKSSKENLARLLQSSRIPNSGRATIVPAPDLNPDEVRIPRHLMYEACQKEFIDYIAEHLGVSPKKAKQIYKKEALSPNIQELFDQYVDGDGDPSKAKYAIINRNPTLYELNMMSCKVKLTNDYAMKIPLQICKPFNADFDGDTMSFYIINKEDNDRVNEVMSPRNLKYYKKNNNPLFIPTHEVMLGLILSTKLFDSGKKLEFESLEDAKKYKKAHREMKYQTPFMMSGKVTSLGREILSEHFGVSITDYLENLTDAKGNPTPAPSLNSKNAVHLYAGLNQFEDRMDRIHAIQEFALLVVTMSGSTTPSLSSLYLEVDPKMHEEMESVENNENLTEPQKELKITEIYEKYCNEELTMDRLEKSHGNRDVELMVRESSRAKISQLMNIINPILTVSPGGKVSVTKESYISGMEYHDYVNVAVENRAVQDIKVSSVPLGGYLTRQFVFLAGDYSYTTDQDKDNSGITLKMKDAVGRTTIDGKLIPENKSEELVKVRSVIKNTLKGGLISSDQLSSFMSFKEGAKIGVSLMSSLTEGLTQGTLALKHGGSLLSYDPECQLYAPEGCSVELTDIHIILHGNSGKDYIYPRPSDFIVNDSFNSEYKKGQLVGTINRKITPAINLDSVIQLVKARGVNNRKSFARNKVIVSDCYAIEDGTIRYADGVVTIGNITYHYDSRCLYFYPDGYQLKAGEKFCSGVVDLNHVLSVKGKDKDLVFSIFHDNIKHYVSGINPVLIEFLFTLIIRYKNGDIHYEPVVNNVLNHSSIYTACAFQNAKKTLTSVTHKGKLFGQDAITRLLLSLLFN